MKSSPQEHPVSEKQAKELLQTYRPMIVVDTNFRDTLRADLLRNAQKKW